MKNLNAAIIRKSSNKEIFITDELKSVIESMGCDYDIEEFDRPQHVNILEWTIPAGITLFLAKPYFEAMMKKLGDASGEAILIAIKNQFAKSKSGNERLISKRDMESVIEIAKEYGEEAADVRYKEVGKKIAPLEIDVHYDKYNNKQFTVRFVFPANLDDDDLDLSLNILKENYKSLIEAIFSERCREISMLDFDDLGTVECIFSKNSRAWLSRKQVLALLQRGLTL